jgi:16S rRNA (cytidine1402-2'-O)-methyltransferase
VFLEAPHRIEAVARDLQTLGSRQLTVGRELTKQFEEVTSMHAQAFHPWLSASPQRVKGEFALLLHPLAKEDDGMAEALRVLELLMAELPLKTAVKLAAEISGAPRNALYSLALQKKPDQL